MPLYANTHTESSGTGLQTTRFREDARRIVREALWRQRERARGDLLRQRLDRGRRQARRDPLTSASRRTWTIVTDLRERIPARGSGPSCSSGRSSTTRTSCRGASPSPMSSTIHEDADGHIDLAQLERELVRYADRPLKIGSFSAASQRHRDRVRHRTRSRGCCTSTAPVASGTSPRPRRTSRSRWTRRGDAARLQGRNLHLAAQAHRWAGHAGRAGGAPRAVPNRVPSMPVVARSRTSTRMSTCIWPTTSIARRAARPRSSNRSAPDSCSSSRRKWVSRPSASARESFINRAIERWQRHPNIEILGNHDAERLSIVSFVVRHGASICTTTSSSRCSTTCSASSRAAVVPVPGRTATGCSASTTRRPQVRERDQPGCEGIKPGWVRVNFNYFISEAVFDFILDAVEIVATRGLAAAPRLRVRAGDGAVASPGRPPRAAALCATSPTTATAWRGRRTGTTSPSRASPTTSSRAARSSAGRRRDAGDADDRRGRRRAWISRRCAGSCSRGHRRACAEAPTGARVPAVLGLDLGTSEAKAALVGLDGTLLGLGRAAIPHRDDADGRAEQDPRDWWAAIGVRGSRAAGRWSSVR